MSEVTVLPERAAVAVVGAVPSAEVRVPAQVHAVATVSNGVSAHAATVPPAVTASVCVDDPLGHVVVSVGEGRPGPPGPGVPPDGLAGHILTKATDDDYDTFWAPPGAATGEVWAFRHVQDTASSVWTVTHPLDFRPTVTVLVNLRGLGLEQVVAEVVWESAATARITLVQALTGEAWLT